jgi:hypothetical protein
MQLLFETFRKKLKIEKIYHQLMKDVLLDFLTKLLI